MRWSPASSNPKSDAAGTFAPRTPPVTDSHSRKTKPSTNWAASVATAK